MSQSSSPEVVWLASGLSTNNLSAEYSPNGTYLLIQTSSGQYQVWKPGSSTSPQWSTSTAAAGAAFSADSQYVLVPGPSGVVRVNAATGATVDSLAASGLSGTPTAVAQYGGLIALATSTKVFVYNYPSMTAVTSFDHTAGSNYPLTFTGDTSTPYLVVGNDATGGSGGARVFNATTGALVMTSQGFPAAVQKSTTAPMVFGMSGGLTNGAKHLYASNPLTASNGELASFFSGSPNTTYNNFSYAGSVDRSGTYLGIPSRNSGQTSENLYFVNPSTGAVYSTASLGLTFSNSNGGAAVRFSPSTDSFVLYGTNAGTNAYAYYYTFNPATRAVSSPTPLIGGNVTSILDGHLPSTSIVHAAVSGTPVTIDGSKGTNSAVSIFRRASADGTGATALSGRLGSQTGFAGMAVSPDGTRLAVVTDAANIKLYTISTGALVATSTSDTSAGVSFFDNNTLYTGTRKLALSGSTFLPTNTSIQTSSPVNSPSGALQLGHDASNPNTMVIMNLTGTNNTRTFSSAPTAYGWIGETTVWVSYSTVTSGTVTVNTEFYSTTWGAGSGQTNRSVGFTRTGGSTETYGSAVGPDGKWIAAYYTGSAAAAAQGGNGNAVPTSGSIRFMSGKSGAIRSTDVTVPIVDGGVSGAAFAADGLHFEYSSTNGSLISTYVPAWMSTLGLTDPSIKGGKTTTATLTLSHAAGPNGVTVPITGTSNVSGSPASITVIPGATSGTTTITSRGVAANSTETVTATYKGETLSQNLTLTPATILSVSLNPTAVLGTNSSVATVTLDGLSPFSTTMSVAMSSDNAAATVPATVTVAANSSSFNVTVNTSAVGSQQTANISASANSSSASAPLTINTPTLQTFALSYSPLVGGNTQRGTVTFDGPSPTAGLSLSITSDFASVPAETVAIPGGVTSYSFNIPTKARNGSATVTVTATLLSTSKSATFRSTAPVFNYFSLDKKRVVGGTPIKATIALTGIAPSGLPVSVSFSNGSASATTPFNFTAKANSMTFTINTSTVATPTTVDITVTIGGVAKTITGVVIVPG